MVSETGMPDPESNHPLTYSQLIRGSAAFRYLWAGQIVSLLGDWFNLIASASLIARLSDTDLAVGSLFVVRMLAPFVVSPFAGVLADRYDRRHILIGTDLLRAVVVCGFLLVRDPAHVWLLYVLTALQLGLSGFFFPAYRAILPDVVSSRGIGAANALTSATWSVMLALGAALGGVVSGGWGVYPAFSIDAVTFVASAALLARIRYVRPVREEEADGGGRGAAREFIDGLTYLRRNPPIALLALHKSALMLFFGGAMDVVSVSISTEVFPLGAGGGTALGLLFAAAGVGSGIGPIAGRAFTGDRPRRVCWAIAVGYLLAAVGLLIISTLHSFAMVLGGGLLRSLGGGIIWVFSTQLLLQLVPEHVRGRVFATESALMTLMGAASAAMGGRLLDVLPVASTLQVLMVGALVPGMLWSGWLLSARGRSTIR